MNLPFSCEGQLVKPVGDRFLTCTFWNAILNKTSSWQLTSYAGKNHSYHGQSCWLWCSICRFVCPGGMFQHLQRLQMNLFLRGGWSENISTKTWAFLTMCGLRIHFKVLNLYTCCAFSFIIFERHLELLYCTRSAMISVILKWMRQVWKLSRKPCGSTRRAWNAWAPPVWNFYDF